MILGQAAGFEESAGKPRASGDDPQDWLPRMISTS